MIEINYKDLGDECDMVPDGDSSISLTDTDPFDGDQDAALLVGWKMTCDDPDAFGSSDNVDDNVTVLLLDRTIVTGAFMSHQPKPRGGIAVYNTDNSTDYDIGENGAIASSTFGGGTDVVITAGPHSITGGQSVYIPTTYNGVHIVTAVSATTFTIGVTESGATETGTWTYVKLLDRGNIHVTN